MALSGGEIHLRYRKIHQTRGDGGQASWVKRQVLNIMNNVPPLTQHPSPNTHHPSGRRRHAMQIPAIWYTVPMHPTAERYEESMVKEGFLPAGDGGYTVLLGHKAGAP